MAADHEGGVLAQRIGKVDQGRPHVRRAGHDEDLRRVRLDVVRVVVEPVDGDQRRPVGLRLARRAPVDLCTIANRQPLAPIVPFPVLSF